uniref:WW domain-containing protein n=1 Tax=Alexandrium catenella TaxID=2925 RepID=A0A7S1S8D0_ALECA
MLRQQVMRSAQAAEDTRDIVLPSGWTVDSTADGRDFYVNAQAGITQWDVPRLPQHWEERFSSTGKVYYLCLFDGRTQWHWPAEREAEGGLRRSGSAGRPEPLMLSDVPLPGGTEPMEMAHDELRSEAGSDVSSAVEAIDQLDSATLLALQVRPVEIDQSGLPPKTEPPPDVVAWGVDRADKDWNDLKTKLQLQKAAQETHFQKAKDNPGIREFIRPHEMTGLTNNWDRQLDNVAMKVDGIQRENLQLGHRSELTKDDLRSIFPIIQRMQWTKWSTIELFWHSFQRARPTQAVFANQGKPTKKHRAYIYGLFIYTMLLACTLMAFFQAPVSEDLTATMRATWTLFMEVLTMPFQAQILLVAVVADVIARFGRYLCYELFFSCSVPTTKAPLRTMTGRREQMRYWHELAEMGTWVCIIGMLLCMAGTVALCSLMPQPRAASVARAFAVAIWLSHLLYPLVEASIVTCILRTACTSGSVDGLLTVFPGIMGFVDVGVKTPEFLAWRVQRIVNEEEMLGQVYGSGLATKVSKVAQGPSSGKLS